MAYFETKDGVTIYYEECGNKAGQPMILIHGWGANHTFYQDSLPMLSDYRCITYDHRGVWKSSLPKTGISIEQLARDLEQLMEHLDLHDVLLLGYSMGGHVVYSYVDQFGTDRLKKIIICDMPPKQVNDADWDQGMNQGKTTKEEAFQLVRAMFDDFPTAYKPTIMGLDPSLSTLTPYVFDLFLKGKMSTNTDYVMAALYYSMVCQDFRPMLHKFDKPTGLFFGDPGSVYQPKTAYYLAEKIPAKTKVVLFKGCSHMFAIEKPELFAQEVRTFWEEDEENN